MENQKIAQLEELLESIQATEKLLASWKAPLQKLLLLEGIDAEDYEVASLKDWVSIELDSRFSNIYSLISKTAAYLELNYEKEIEREHRLKTIEHVTTTLFLILQNRFDVSDEELNEIQQSLLKIEQEEELKKENEKIEREIMDNEKHLNASDSD